ncbi:MAG: class I SAM-dependent methyltransferase [Rhodospirillales bacterium]|nr:class I SAM-dependent methyltransferase [Rhodospirillales bacterium]
MIIDFARFPFFVGMREPGDANGLPSHLPLGLRIDPRTAVPRLALSPEIEDALDKAYGRGSLLSTPLGVGPLAEARLHDVLSGLLDAFEADVAGKRFLEIGCGYGHLLNELQERGATVAGCEIGPQGVEAKKQFGFPVVSEPLRPGLFDQPFDCIYSYGALEHITDLTGFLAAGRSCLKDGGLFFHSVPNMDTAYAALRFEELSHEHVSYFTAENGVRLFEAQGFRGAIAAPTVAGNELHLWGRLDNTAKPVWPGETASVVAGEAARLSAFVEACRIRLERQIITLKAMLAEGQRIGFYAGGHSLGSNFIDSENIRYYDGDAAKHGKCWLAGLPAVRDPMSLRDDPVDTLIVCREHYFEPIRQYLRTTVQLPAATRLIKLSELSPL